MGLFRRKKVTNAGHALSPIPGESTNLPTGRPWLPVDVTSEAQQRGMYGAPVLTQQGAAFPGLQRWGGTEFLDSRYSVPLTSDVPYWQTTIQGGGGMREYVYPGNTIQYATMMDVAGLRVPVKQQQQLLQAELEAGILPGS